MDTKKSKSNIAASFIMTVLCIIILIVLSLNIMKKILTSYNDISLKYRYLICFILLLPPFLFRDFAIPTELKYLSIVDEALRNNTLFTFYNHGEIYADKPPLYFWLLMVAKMITGKHLLWVIGLFSLIPAIGIAAVMDKWFKKFNVSHNPVISNVLLFTTVLFSGLAMFGRMDMLMCFFIVMSLYTFFRIYQNEYSAFDTWLLPVYIFLAVFSKGALGFLIPVVSIIVFLIVEKQIRKTGNYLGLKQLAIFGGLCTVWFSFVYREGGSEYIYNLLFIQTVGRGINSFAHKEPVWYYFPRILWSFAPWTLLYIAMIFKGIRNKLFASDTFRFFAVIMATNLIMLSFISAKVDVYLLPVYPFAVYLCSSIFFANNAAKSVKICLGLQAVIFVLFLPFLFIAEKYIPFDVNLTLLYFGCGAVSLSGLIAIGMITGKKTLSVVTVMGFGLILLLCSASFMTLQFNKYTGFREAARAAEQIAKAEHIENYATYKYSMAQNMDVFLNLSIDRITSVEQLDSLNRLPQKTILYVRKKEIREEEEFRTWISSRQPKWDFGNNAWYVIGGNDVEEKKSKMDTNKSKQTIATP